MHRGTLLIAVLFLAAVLLPAPVNAQTSSVSVNRRDIDITIQSNGDVRFNETWEVKFVGGPFTFGYRSIGLNRLDYIDGFQVAEGREPYQRQCNETSGTFTTYVEKGQHFVKWFFPPSSNQIRTFRLQYVVHGALRIYDAGDQLWWEAIESDRSYTIETSTITVHLPGALQADQIRAAVTAGVGTAAVLDGRTALFTSRDLRGGTGLEIRVQFPHGAVASKPSKWQVDEDKLRAAEQQRSALEDKLRISEKQQTALEDKLRISEEKRDNLEVELRASEEQVRTLEGRLGDLQSTNQMLAIGVGLAVAVALCFAVGLVWTLLRQRA